MADSAIKYVYQSPNAPRHKPSKLQTAIKIGSYIATALVFSIIGLLAGQNLPSLSQNQTASTTNQSQSSLTIQARKDSAPKRNEQILILDDGKAVYKNNQTKDEIETQIPTPVLTTLQGHILSANFFALNEKYTTGCKNCLTYKVTVKFADTTKTVEAEWGDIKQPSELAPLFTLFETVISEIKKNPPQ